MDTYLLELVRYIHLNPLRAGIVTSQEELRRYRYSGHGRLLGAKVHLWQERQEILSYFDEDVRLAMQKYEAYVAEGIAMGKRPDLTGGGLVRSAGGWGAILSARRAGTILRSDERILGDSDFVESVLKAAEERVERETLYKTAGISLEDAARRVAQLMEMNVDDVLEHSKKPTVVQARSLLCYWAVREVGMTTTDVAGKLGISQSAVSRLVVRGEHFATEKGWQLQ